MKRSELRKLAAKEDRTWEEELALMNKVPLRFVRRHLATLTAKELKINNENRVRWLARKLNLGA